jgi:hypothetical protein
VSYDDWTKGRDGRSNTSPLFEALVKEVGRLIRDDAHALLAGRAEETARLIMAQLAHAHGLRPPPSK